MSWPPGTIVICVDDSASRPDGMPVPLVKGGYYTVNQCFMDESCVYGRIEFTEIREAMNDPVRDGIFASFRFRKAESDHSESSSLRRKEPVSV